MQSRNFELECTLFVDKLLYGINNSIQLKYSELFDRVCCSTKCIMETLRNEQRANKSATLEGLLLKIAPA